MNKKIILFSVIFGIIFFSITKTVNAQDWPMFHHNLRNTGYTNSSAPLVAQVLWRFRPEGGGIIWSSAAIVGDVLYFGAYDDKLYAINVTTGQKIWDYLTDGDIVSSPTYADGFVYFGVMTNKTIALNATNGNHIWTHIAKADPGGDDNEILGSPAVAYGMVYTSSYDRHLYALNQSTGQQIWNFSARADFATHGSPAVVDGVVYLGDFRSGGMTKDGGKMYAINAYTGQHIWNFTTGHVIESAPAVVDGIVYFGSDDYNVYALNKTTGAKIWNYTTGDYAMSSPAVHNGVVFIGSRDYHLYAFDALTGTQIWNYSSGHVIKPSPAVAGGLVIAGNTEGKIFALNETTGQEVWTYNASTIAASPAVSDGVVYVGSWNGYMYAIGNCVDNDGDGYNGTANCPMGTDCDDNNATLNLDDIDADGYSTCDNDCDDNDNTIYPGATELCDGKDNDCDGSIPWNETDADNDGFRICDGDCDDNNPLLNMWIAHQCLNINCTPVIFNGNVSDKIDVVFVGSGFTSFSLFNQTVFELIDYSGTSNGLMSVQPFSGNKTKFNFWLVNKTETYTNSTFRTASTTTASICPFADEKIVLLVTPRIWNNADAWGVWWWNSPLWRWEWNWTDSGGFGMYVTVGTQFLTNTGWPLRADFNVLGQPITPQILSNNKNQVKMSFTHEFGHSFGGLFDEYQAFNCVSNVNCNPIAVVPPSVANCDLTPCNKWSGITTYCQSPCGYSDWCRSTADSLMRSIPANPPQNFNTVSQNELRKDMSSYKTGTSNITIGVPSPAPQSSYVLPLTYTNKTFLPGSLAYVPTSSPGGSSQPSTGYTVNVVSSNGTTLYSVRMGIDAVVGSPSPEWFDEYGNQIYFPDENVSVLDPYETKVILPTFPDAETINMYDPEGELIFEILIENTPPVADPNGPYVYEIKTGGDLILDGSGSYDPNEPLDYIEWYEWDLNGDSFFDVVVPTPYYDLPYDGPEPNILDTVCNGSCGHCVPYNITLRVTDTHGESGNNETSLKVYENGPPVAHANGPYEILEGEPLGLDGSGSTEPDAECGDSIVEYRWDLNEDGLEDIITIYPIYDLSWDGPEPNVLDTICKGSCIIGTPYTVTLTVEDELGETTTVSTTVTIIEPIPLPVANPDGPYYVEPNDEIQFDGSGSSHEHPDRTIVSYEWDFNADSFFDVYTEDPYYLLPWDGPEPNVIDTICDGNCVYGSPYPITLRVTDDINQTDEASTNLTIIPPINVIFPEDGVTYPKRGLDLKVMSDISIDSWWYNLNYEDDTSFDPNTTFIADECSNILYGYAESFAGIQHKIIFFNVFVGDITGSDSTPELWVPDGKVDIKDIATVAIRFGAIEGDEKYDIRADLTGPDGTPDGKIDIRDIATVAQKFGDIYEIVCSKPQPKMILPKDGDIVSGYTVIAATDLKDTPPEEINSVEFQYSTDGEIWYPIDGIWGTGEPKDADELFWENVWNTTDVDSGDYLLRIYVDSVYGTAEHIINVEVNKGPVPIVEVYNDTANNLYLDGSLTYDPEANYPLNHSWIVDHTTTYYGGIVSFPITPPTPDYTGVVNYYVEHNVEDDIQIITTDHYIIVIVWASGVIDDINITEKSCGCASMDVKNPGTSHADQYWMPDGKKRQLGGYDNINMSQAGDPSFQIVHNFQVEASLVQWSDPTKCTEFQRVKRTATRGGNEYNKTGPSCDANGNLGGQVTAPYNGPNWVDDDYRNANSVTKFHIDQSKIIWMDGPGNDNVLKSDLPYTYKANFDAKVTGPLGWCRCTWDVVIDTAAGTNTIQNKVCTSG